MSSYLMIKKNGVKLCCFNRNTEFYQAFENIVSFENWSELTDKQLWRGYDEVVAEIKNYRKAIEREKTALNYLKGTEEIYEAIGTIDSMMDTIEELTDVKAYIRFLIFIWEEDPGGMEWRVE